MSRLAQAPIPAIWIIIFLSSCSPAWLSATAPPPTCSWISNEHPYTSNTLSEFSKYLSLLLICLQRCHFLCKPVFNSQLLCDRSSAITITRGGIHTHSLRMHYGSTTWTTASLQFTGIQCQLALHFCSLFRTAGVETGQICWVTSPVHWGQNLGKKSDD